MGDKKTKEAIKKIIFQHLSPNEYHIFLFGSRASGTHRKWSDYDIGILGKEEIPAPIITQIEEGLDQSNIPYVVEVVDFNCVSDRFKSVALTKIKSWSPPKS